MTNKEKAFLIDEIVKYCSERTVTTITNRHLAEHFNTDYSIIYAITQDLIYKGYLKNHANISSKEDYTDFDMILIITPQGRYFLNHEGGATQERKKRIQNQFWDILKIVAAAANASIIILVSIWGISVNNKTKRTEDDIIQKDSIIYHQTKQIENLYNIIRIQSQDSVKPN